MRKTAVPTAKEQSMDGLTNEMQSLQSGMADMAQAALSANVAKQAMEFQGSMVNAIITGGDQGMEIARNAGLAAQGIGSKLNVAV